VKDHLQKHVAELLLHFFGVAVVKRIEQFIGFF
jgi:hypothetical protein